MTKKKIGCIFLCMIMALGLFACGNVETTIEEVREDSIDDEEATEQFKKFTSVDIYGNVVTEDIIKDKELVMINIWAMFCGPCLSEMPDLGELAEEYADKDVIIIGICVDIYEDSDQATAVEIVEDTGANYTHLMVSDDLYNIYISEVQAVPETIFLDSTGTIIDSVIGAQSKSKWEDTIDNLLK